MNFRKIRNISLLAVIILPLFGFGKCNVQKVERPLVAAGYNLQISFHAAARVLKAYRDNKPEEFSEAEYVGALQLIDKLSEGGQTLSLTIDQTVEINPTTKAQLVAEIKKYVAATGGVDLLFIKNPKVRASTEKWLLIVDLVADSILLTVSNISVPTEVVKVNADVTKAAKAADVNIAEGETNSTQARARRARAAEDSDTRLIRDLGAAASMYAADLKLQSGFAAADLRKLRDKARADLHDFILQELEPKPASK